MRPVVLALPGEPVTCAAGHALGALDASGLRPCDVCGGHAWVWRHADGAHTVVHELDATDRAILARGSLTPRAVRDYLGLRRQR